MRLTSDTDQAQLTPNQGPLCLGPIARSPNLLQTRSTSGSKLSCELLARGGPTSITS